LEFDSISEWLVSESLSSLVEDPSLVLSVVAVPEDDVSVVGVRSTMNIQALLTIVSEVSH
jgi:hypothetical protein